MRKNLEIPMEEECIDCPRLKLNTDVIYADGYENIENIKSHGCKHREFCRDIVHNLKEHGWRKVTRDEVEKVTRDEVEDNFAEWLSTDKFHYCKCSACKTVFAEEMFFDNPDFRFCPWCGTPIKEEGDDEGGNGEE